jgi:hypothetical protein
MLLSRLVGPTGEVVAIERDARSINRAQTRAAEAGFFKVFRDAGLPAPSMRLEMELGHDPDFTRWVSDVVSSVRPQIEKLNLPLEELGDLDTL